MADPKQFVIGKCHALRDILSAFFFFVDKGQNDIERPRGGSRRRYFIIFRKTK